MTDNLVSELRALIADDHARGCQGRCYACTCGYDDKVYAILTRAADALEPSGDVVERVARAIAIADAKDGCRSLLLHNEGYMSHARILAKAAIAALGASHAEC